jgi:hypothetical protein
MHGLRYKPLLQAVVVAAGMLSLVALSAWLPHRFPDNAVLSFLFGHHRYIVFWLTLSLAIFLWLTRAGRRPTV